jgi:hypothetical protein
MEEIGGVFLSGRGFRSPQGDEAMPKPQEPGAGKGSSRTGKGTREGAARQGADPPVKRPSHHALKQASGSAAPGVPAKRARRPAEKSGGVGRLLAVAVVLVLAAICVVLVLKELRLADRTYWEEFQRTKIRIERTEDILPAEILRRVQQLPIQSVEEPALRELHQAWLDWAQALQDEKETGERRAALQQRFKEAHTRAARVMGGAPPEEPTAGGTAKPFKPLQP